MASLIVIPFVPAVNAPQAGHRLAFEAVQHHVAAGMTHLLLLLKHIEPLPKELISLCGQDNITVVRVGRPKLLSALLAKPGVYPRFLTRYSAEALRMIQTLLEKRALETLRLEFSQTFIYADLLRRSGVALPKIVMVTHDLQTQVVSRQDSLEYWALPWVLRSERALMAAADEIVVLSDKDKVLMSSLVGYPGPMRVENPGLSQFTRDFRRIPNRVEKNSLLFWGAMGRAENEESMLQFHEEVLEPLRREGRHFKLYIVGSAPGPKIQKLAGNHCIITGFVEDPTPYFERCAIGVVPLLRGAGIKLKTLEMLACGLKVVATPVGAEGIDIGTNLTVCALSEFKTTLAALHVAE